MLERIGRSPYDRYRKFLLTNLAEVYFELGENERERFERALSRPEFREAKKMAVSYVDEIMERGREQGRNEGLLQGKQDTLLRMLRKKFGDVPEETVVRVQAIASVASLDALIDRVLESSTLDEMDLPK